MKLSREESEAILEGSGVRADGRGPEVSPRDFRQPHRLSRAERQALRDTVDTALSAVDRRLSGWLGAGANLALDDVAEVSAVGLFDDLEDPFTLLELRAGETQGWIALANESAQKLASLALGAPGDDVEGSRRRLTSIEAGLVSDVLTEVATGIGQALGVELSRGPLLQDARALRLALAGDLAREPQRVAVHLALSGPGFPTATLRLYVPGALNTGRAGVAARGVAPPLPGHLAGVSVDVSAQLGTIEVPLSDLLALEVGDVVPLGVADGAPASILVEDQECGHALWGGREGGLALRVLDFVPPEEEQ